MPRPSSTICATIAAAILNGAKFIGRTGRPLEVDKQLVRGLDYYTRTTFEIQTGALGAQSAVAGGGRYDGLVEALGGPEVRPSGLPLGLTAWRKLSP